MTKTPINISQRKQSRCTLWEPVFKWKAFKNCSTFRSIIVVVFQKQSSWTIWMCSFRQRRDFWDVSSTRSLIASLKWTEVWTLLRSVRFYWNCRKILFYFTLFEKRVRFHTSRRKVKHAWLGSDGNINLFKQAEKGMLNNFTETWGHIQFKRLLLKSADMFQRGIRGTTATCMLQCLLL